MYNEQKKKKKVIGILLYTGDNGNKFAAIYLH